MKTKTSQRTSPGIRGEYDFRNGARGKYAVRYARGTNLVKLEPDVARVFHTSTAVNRALRALSGALRLVGPLPSR